MKLLTLAFLTLLILAQPASTQTAFPTDGVDLLWDQAFEGTSNAVFPEGGLLAVWTDVDLTGVKRVYYQIVSSEGELTFEHDTPPSLSPEGQHAVNPSAVSGLSENVFVKWFEKRDPVGWTARLQRFDRQGNGVCDGGGAAFCETDSVKPPYVDLRPDSSGGCLAAVHYEYMNADNYDLFTFDSVGQIREGWPQEGLRIGEPGVSDVFTDDQDGFWVVFQNQTFNRLTARGEFVWGANVELESQYDRLFRVLASQSGDYLFACFGDWADWDGGPNLEVVIYNLDGQRLRQDRLLRGGNEGAVHQDTQILLTSDNQLYVLYADFGFQGEGGIGQVGPPMLERYDPFGQNRFPWGIRLPEGGDWPPDLRYMEMTAFRDRIFIHYDDCLFGYNRDGRALWNEQPRPWQINGYFRGFLPGDSECWITAYGDYSIHNALVMRMDENAEILTGDEPVSIFTQTRDLGNFTASLISGDRLNVVCQDHIRGLVGQTVNVNGEISQSVIGTPLGLDVSREYETWKSGVIGGRQWIFQDRGRGGRLSLLDADNQLLDSVSFENGWVMDDNNRDALLIVRNSGEDAELVSLDTTGWPVAQVVVADPEPGLIVQTVWYWPDNGWVISVANDGRAYLFLFDDNLQQVWNTPLYFDYEIRSVRFENDQLTTVGATHTGAVGQMMARWGVVSREGALLEEHTSPIFAQDVPNYQLLNAQFALNGNTWFHFSYQGTAYYQLTGIEGRRFLGESGIVIPNGYGSRVVPDLEGGGWLFWPAESSIRFTHLDEEGLPWRDRYPAEGFELFNDRGYTIERAFLNPASGRVWVAAFRRLELFEYNIVTGYKAQLVGDEYLPNSVSPSPFNPLTFNLLTPFPNPFNSSTTISYTIPKPGRYALDVVDISGRLVTRLSDGWKEAGSYREVWDGREAGSGEYFLRISGRGIADVQSIQIVR